MQKAPRLRLHGQLSSWLYGVAVKIARRTQTRDARLHSEMGQGAQATISEQQTELTVRELMEVVHHEVQRLPRRYQPVLELCLFDQMSVREAAERLQISVGIVRGCLERGRKQLQARLLRRGIAPLALGTLSLTVLNAHPVSVDLVAVVQGMVHQEVPARLMTLTATSLSTFRPVIAQLALVMVLITGVGMGLASLIAMPVPKISARVNSVQNRVKLREKVQGFVDDHQGKPVAHAKVEVYRDGKLVQAIQADGLGRFEIPEAWRQQPVNDRTLIVRQGEKALGWYTRMSSHEMMEHDVHIVVLPFEATVRGKIRNEQDKTLTGRLGRFFWFDHSINGSLNNLAMPREFVELPGSMDAEGRFSVRLPIQTQGMVFVGAAQYIDQRVPYHSTAAGVLDAGDLTLKPSASIKGVVQNGEGKPLAGVVIYVQMENSLPQGEHFLDGTWGEAITTADGLGRFQIDGLEPRARFNVSLKEPYQVTGQEVPLTMRSKEKVTLSVEKPAELVLTMEPAKKIAGRLIDAASGKPLAQVGVGYHGSARPFSSAAIMGTTTDQQGNFHFWAPPGRTMLYCNDGKYEASVEVTIPEKETPSIVTMEANKLATPQRYMGDRAVMGLTALLPQAEKGVFAADDAKQVRPALVYHQIIELKTDQKLPAHAHWRVYSHDQPMESASFMHRFCGVQSLPGNTMLASIPQDNDGALKLEIDLEGFQPWIQPVKHSTNREPLTINLTPARYVPIQVHVEDQQGRVGYPVRVQVELKRLGTTVDAPWGPVLITDEQGKGRIEHLRVGDTYRLRAWGQDGSTGVTDWKKISDHSEKVIEMKLSPTAR
ncbi:MAG: sigma factor-like helix-turn-helix DNA-binding protein [Gemmatales bacterium]